MKYCLHCGNELTDDARFCVACGAQTDSDPLAEEKEFLQQTHRFLKYERLCCKIPAIFFLIFSLLFIGISLLFLILSPQMHYENGQIGMALMFGIYFVYGLFFLPISIINFVMVKKATKYMNGIYVDPRHTLDRCGSVGRIVLAAFFNNIALVFIIINFVRMKNNAALIERIKQRYEQL